MLKIFKTKYFLFKSGKNKHKKGKTGKAKKEKFLLLIPENIGDRELSISKTKIPTEWGKVIRGFNN